MLRIAIVTGSTRPGRNGGSVAEWVKRIAGRRSDAEFEVVDIAEHNLPLFDEPAHPMLGQYSHSHTKEWSKRIDSFDGYIFVTPEYNRSIPAALKNAIDYLHREWKHKAAAIVSYGGGSAGAGAAEHLQQILKVLKLDLADAQVMLSLRTDFENYTTFNPEAKREDELNHLLDEVVQRAETQQNSRAAMAEHAAAA